VVDNSMAQAQIAGWQRTIDTAFAGLQPEPGLLDTLENGAARVVNGVASFGNAMLHNPGAVLELAGGAALATAGGLVEVPGVALDATGAGAVAGVPINVAGVGMMAAGGGMAADATRRLLDAAAGPDQVAPMQTDWKFKEDPAKTAEKIQQQQQESANAHDKAMANGGKAPKDTPPLFRGKGKNK
jgi:hypothetical protein